MEATFENDVPTGSARWWHTSGELASQGQYLEGQPHGAWGWWFDNGSKRTEGMYSSGKPTGKWYIWKLSGELDYVKQFGLQVP